MLMSFCGMAPGRPWAAAWIAMMAKDVAKSTARCLCMCSLSSESPKNGKIDGRSMSRLRVLRMESHPPCRVLSGAGRGGWDKGPQRAQRDLLLDLMG